MKISTQLIKLIDVKSILTIILTITFAVLVITGAVASNEFLPIFTMVVSFYFGVQTAKKDSGSK